MQEVKSFGHFFYRGTFYVCMRCIDLRDKLEYTAKIIHRDQLELEPYTTVNGRYSVFELIFLSRTNSCFADLIRVTKQGHNNIVKVTNRVLHSRACQVGGDNFLVDFSTYICCNHRFFLAYQGLN